MTDNFKIGINRRIYNKSLKDKIESSGLIAKEIREKTGINETFQSYIINFKRNPSEHEKAMLAIVLECPIDEIFPEKYDLLYEKISPIVRDMELKVDFIKLNAPEVLQIQAAEDVEFIERQADNAIYKRMFDKAKEELTPREREVIRLRFDESKNLEEVAEIFSVTRERIRQIEAKALETMRQKLKLEETIVIHSFGID